MGLEAALRVCLRRELSSAALTRQANCIIAAMPGAVPSSAIIEMLPSDEVRGVSSVNSTLLGVSALYRIVEGAPILARYCDPEVAYQFVRNELIMMRAEKVQPLANDDYWLIPRDVRWKWEGLSAELAESAMVRESYFWPESEPEPFRAIKFYSPTPAEMFSEIMANLESTLTDKILAMAPEEVTRHRGLDPASFDGMKLVTDTLFQMSLSRLRKKLEESLVTLSCIEEKAIALIEAKNLVKLAEKQGGDPDVVEP
ncbi:MAG: hypothetical protein Q7R39_12650 [Dehalococcoidia bacterium]|nr:hypothetical protein [Dehalococcoidia bacterium]